MKNKEIIFFDSTDDSKLFDDMREFLFDAYAQENGWKTKADIPEEYVWNEVCCHLHNEYTDFINEFDHYLTCNVCILQGVCVRWNGPMDCGSFIRSYEDIRSGIDHLEYIKFYEKNGHFYIEGSHHDGYDKYELRQLTAKGIALAERHWFAQDRQLHNKIMQNSNYSRRAMVARTIYGA